MKKKDIKSGMVVKLRKGCWCLAIMHDNILKFVSKECLESDIDDYNDLLEFQFECIDVAKLSRYDIIAVATTKQRNLVRLDESKFDIIWEREERVEMTIRDIEEKLGYKIKIV